jgi:hypothetical protein
MDALFYMVVVRFFAAPHSDVASILAFTLAGARMWGLRHCENSLIGNVT